MHPKRLSMPRTHAARIAAAALLLSIVAIAAPASAATAPANESNYATVLRTINPQLTAQRARAYARSIMADAGRTHLDPRFIMSIVTVESHWRSNAVSRVGARGLGQLMPGTAANLGVHNSWNAGENLRGTSTYLKSLVQHFAGKKNGVSLAIAGYNAGPKAVERYHGIPPYAETQNYVVRVLHVWNELDGKIGRAFTSQHAPVAIAARLPDEQAWVSGATHVLPDVAPAAPVPVSAAPDDAK